jgi:hypothetical protein
MCGLNLIEYNVHSKSCRKFKINIYTVMCLCANLSSE